MNTDWLRGFGMRENATPKGGGFANIQTGNSTVTELSAGPREELYPLMYQGITPTDYQTLMAYVNGGQPDMSFVDLHAQWAAAERQKLGLSPFQQSSDGPASLDQTPVMQALMKYFLTQGRY